MKSPKFIMPVQSFAFGGIANPAQSTYLSSADKAYLGEQQQKLDAFEQQRLAYNDALTAWQEKQYNPYVAQAEAYNAAAKKYNDEVYSPYQSAYDEYTKAVADWNAGSRTADYAGPSMPTLASTFDMVAPKEPGAFDMVAPEVPFKEEEIAAYQQAAGRRAQDSAAKRAVAIDVVSDPERFNFGSMSISNRFMAEGGEVKDKRSARAMLDEVDGADDDAAVLRMVGELKSGGKLSDDEIMQAVDMIAAQGRGGDELLAFLSPESVVALKRMGGSGTINPVTGLPEFKGSPVKRAIDAVKKALGLQKEPAPAAAAPVATSSLIGAKPVAPPVVAAPVAPPVVAEPVAPPTAKEDLEKIAAPKEKPSVRPSLLEEGWKAPEGAASMALVTWYNKDSGESRTVPTGGWTPPSGSWSTTPPQAGTVPAPKVAPVPVKQPPVVAKPVAPPVVAKPVAPPVVAEPVAFPTAKEDLEKITAPIPAPEPPPPPPVARDRMDVPGMIRSMPGGPISVMPGTVQPGPDAYSGVSPIDYRSFLSTNTPVASPISNFRQPATFEGGLSRPTVRGGLSPVVVPTAGSEPVSRESSSAYQPTFNLAQQYGNVTNPQNYFSMVPGSSTGISPGTSAIGSPDMPISSARNTLNALNNNKNLSPTMLGGAENAGYMVDRLGNMIYSPGAFQPTRSFKEGGAANADEVDTPINTDPLGTAQQFLSQLLGSSSKAAAPTLKSVKRKTASGGAKKSDEMVMGYEAGAKEAASKDSARAQMEELARLYKEKAVQAADVSRGFGKNTFGAPTLAGRTLTKNTLAKKRFAEGGEAKKSELAEDERKKLGLQSLLGGIGGLLEAPVSYVKERATALATDPIGDMKRTMQGTIDRAKQREQLQQIAYGDPQNPTRVTDQAAADQLAQDYLDMASTIMPAGMTVFHGSPYKFSTFDHTKIGSGEGAQAYGYGHYVAENPSVAKEYQADRKYVGKALAGAPEKLDYGPDWIAKNALDVHGDDAISHLEGVLKMNLGSKNKRQIESNEDVFKAIDLLKSNKFEASGNLYKVDLPDEQIEKMLDWNTELGKQTPEIQKLAKQYGLGMDDLGGDLVAAMNAKLPEGAEAMRSAGVPGIKYFDAQSRGGKQADTRSFVVFPKNEGLLKIEEVNGQPVLGPAERAKGSPEEGEVKDKYETFKSNFADYKTLDPRAVEEAAFISKNLTVKTDPDNPGSTIPNKPRDQLGRAGQELLDFLEKTGKMPTVVESRRFPGNSYEGPSFQYIGLNDEDTGVVRFPSFKKDPYGSLVHELTHASDRAMLLGRSDLLKRLKKGEEISPEDQRFLDGYMKLYKESTKLPLNISDDDLTDSDKKYRTSRNELRAFGAGNMAQDPPEAGRYTQQDVGETLNPHVDPTMATEAAIMRELYLRRGKKSKK
jgi:hypothetical protein